MVQKHHVDKVRKDKGMADLFEFLTPCHFGTESVLKKEITDTVYTLLLNQKSPRLKDALLRSALLQTVDQGFVPQENTGGYMVQKDLLPPAIRLAPKTNAAKADPDGGREALRLYLAKEELEKTGAFTILLPKAGFHREMLTLLQQAWQKELGVYVNLDLGQY